MSNDSDGPATKVLSRMVLLADHAPSLAAAVITTCVFGYLTYGLRAYTRIRYSSRGPEDSCMTAAITMTFLPYTQYVIMDLIAGLYIIFHAVGLTAAEDYLYALPKTRPELIGKSPRYAENGLGLIFGCMATLKPLFRDVFQLSRSDRYLAPQPFGGGGPAARSPAKARGELIRNSGPSPNMSWTRAARTARTAGASSDSESQKEILQSNNIPGTIAVSREVHITEEH
ncbi:hypothetical protein DL765_006014 [Monosporascus sp. GIB2]|nr:hypothetical protein DL765_006014 [Monosporascus sp. GIB2]